MVNRIDYIIKYVKSILFDESTGHDYFHAIRVMDNAIILSKNLSVNLEVIKVSSLTHDLIDKKVSIDVDASLKDLVIQLNKAEYSEPEVNEIISIIKRISYSKGLIPASLEGKIVQDADRLDALGAIGIARAFAYGGRLNRQVYNPEKDDNLNTISHFYEKLLKLPDLMNTDKAREIAQNRTKFMKEYLNRFYIEWDSNDLK